MIDVYRTRLPLLLCIVAMSVDVPRLVPNSTQLVRRRARERVTGEERVKSWMFYLCGKAGAGAPYAASRRSALQHTFFWWCSCGETIVLCFFSLLPSPNKKKLK